ncbi:hypothetical protein PENTCL1PPCAC_25965, partial [Pristionchus entomophagus]
VRSSLRLPLPLLALLPNWMVDNRQTMPTALPRRDSNYFNQICFSSLVFFVKLRNAAESHS